MIYLLAHVMSEEVSDAEKRNEFVRKNFKCRACYATAYEEKNAREILLYDFRLEDCTRCPERQEKEGQELDQHLQAVISQQMVQYPDFGDQLDG